MCDFDLLIAGAELIDGTGTPAVRKDILVRDGKIAAIGDFGELADTVRGTDRFIDAEGMYVTPGFIDIHRHADAEAFREGYGELELSQGLTTIVNGNCGLSVAPVSGTHQDEIKAYLRPITGLIGDDVPMSSMKEYLSAVPKKPINSYMLAGAGILRADAAGYTLTRLNDEHYRTIHAAMEKALSEGALGVSLGMGYAPECFYTTDELIRALEPLRNTSIPVTVHMRQEGSGVVDSVREMLTVARTLNCPMHISHLKAMGRDNWGTKIGEALKLLGDAKTEGYDVGCDVYPYTAGSTQFMHILPPDYLTGGIDAVVARLSDKASRRELDDRIEGRSACENFDNIAKLAGWDGIYLTTINSQKNKIYQGKSVLEIAQMRGTTPLDAACDLLAEERCQITMIDFMASEDDIISILRSPLSNVISDATYPTEGQRHPRVCGTCTHVLEHFVKELKAISLEEAVHKMTSVPASVLRIEGKGIVREGMDADLCIFDIDKIHENATYDDPTQKSEGMSYVIVGGRIAHRE